MKMSSWIFLLISALLIISGLFLCNYARSIAPSDEAIDGNITSEDGQSLSELDYADMNISTISLELENCRVEIRGGAEEAKVQMLGFRPNTFINSVSNKTLTISNQISILDYLNLDGSGVSFAGVWQTILSFTRKVEVTEEPTVLVYIPDDFEIKQFSLSFTNCDVIALDIGDECDLALYANKSTVEFNRINASMVDFESEESDISLLNSTFVHFNIKSEGGKFASNTFKADDITVTGDNGDYTLLKTDFKEFNLNMDTCELLLDSIYTQGSYQRDLSVEDGEIFLGELLLGQEDLSPEDESSPGTIIAALKDGKITTQYGSLQLSVEDPVEDTEDNSGEDDTENNVENSGENGDNSSN